MTTPTFIKDGKGTKKSAHLYEREDNVGLIAYTDPLKEYSTVSYPFFNSEEGVEMSVDASFGGTPENIHNGENVTYWAGSQITGGNEVTFDSGTRGYGGSSQSVYVNRADLNETWQFAKGSDVTLSSYSAITMYIYVDNNWAAGDSQAFYGWDTDLSVQVGTAVNLEDYFPFGSFDAWHKLTIPLSDMGIETATTVDAFRMEAIAIQGQRPRWYIDDIQIQQTGSSVAFSVTPEVGTIFYYSELRLNLVDFYDGTGTDSSMPNLSYEKLLGVGTLVNGGITLTRTKEGVVDFAVSLTCLNDFFMAGADITNVITDGTNTSITLTRKFDPPFVLDSREDDSSALTINDDLSGLLTFTALAVGKVETI